MARWKAIARATALGLLWLLAPGGPPAADAETTVVEEILDILRDKNDISDAQYQALRERAQQEAALQAEQAAAEAIRAANAASQSSAPVPNRLEASWKNGLRFTSADEAFDVRIGGRIHNDWAVLMPDESLQDFLPDRAGKGTGTRFRRARLAVQGTLYERVGFKAEYDFAGGNVGFTDVYGELFDLPVVGTARVGRFKEPMSLEQMTSSNHITLLERSLADTFVPARQTGFMIQNHALEQRVTWAVGGFRNTAGSSGDGFSNDAIYDLTGRVTGLPWYEEDGAKLLHVGLAASQQFRDGTNERFSSKPEASLASNFVDTGSFATDHIQIVNPELALVYGPFSLQSEYIRAFVDGSGGDTGNPSFDAFYVMGSYFLTGEHRRYKMSAGAFDRVVPSRNLDREGGLGAFELTARLSRIDLDSEGISGGTLTNGTLGLNWYLNPNVRTMLNYGLGRLEGEGWTNQVQTRFQVDF